MRWSLRKLSLFEDFKMKNITADDIVRCIDQGGVIYATVVRGLPGNDPDMPMLPVSVDEEGVVTVFVDGAYREVALDNVDRIEWSGGGPGRVDEALRSSYDLSNVLNHLSYHGDKVADFLYRLTFSDAYPDKEDLNFLELAKDVNKIAFIPAKRRTGYQFDAESMPTRIGKVVRKIYKTVEDQLTFKVDQTTNIHHRQRDDDTGKMIYGIEVKDPLFVYGALETHGPVGVSLSVDGEVVDADFRQVGNHYLYTTGGMRVAECVFVATDADIKEGRHKVKLELKSNIKIADKDIAEFVNGMVAFLKVSRSGEDSVITTVSGEDIRHWYLRDNYQATSGELSNSCMSYDYCQGFLDLYCMNPDQVSLLVLKSKEDKLIGRALLWTLDNGDKFMDRVYSVMDSDRRLFTDHARDNGWVHTKDGMLKKGKELYDESHLYVTLDRSKFDYYPYLDTLKYLAGDTLSAQGDSDDKYLNCTDGNYTYDEDYDD